MSNPIFPYGNSSYISLTSFNLKEQWRPFFLYGDNRIHQLILPDVFDFDSFTDAVIDGPAAMPGSPIAVIGWGIDKSEASVPLYA